MIINKIHIKTVIYFLLFTYVSLPDTLFSQTTFDRLFISETEVLIGNFVSDDENFIYFYDIERNRELAIPKNSVLRIINSDNETLFENLQINSTNNITHTLKNENEVYLNFLENNPDMAGKGFLHVNIRGVFNATQNLIEHLNSRIRNNAKDYYNITVKRGGTIIYQTNSFYSKPKASKYNNRYSALIDVIEGSYTVEVHTLRVSSSHAGRSGVLNSEPNYRFNIVVTPGNTTYVELGLRVSAERSYIRMRDRYTFEYEILELTDPYFDEKIFQKYQIINDSGGSAWDLYNLIY